MRNLEFQTSNLEKQRWGFGTKSDLWSSFNRIKETWYLAPLNLKFSSSNNSVTESYPYTADYDKVRQENK